MDSKYQKYFDGGQIVEALNYLYTSKDNNKPLTEETLEWANTFLDNDNRKFNEFLSGKNISAIPEALMEYPFLFEGKSLSRERVISLFEEWKLNRE